MLYVKHSGFRLICLSLSFLLLPVYVLAQQAGSSTAQSTADGKDHSGLSREDQFAMALAAAQTDEQRARLLAQEPELINVALRRALLRELQRLQNEGDYARLLAMARLTVQVARQAGDNTGLVRATTMLGLAYFLRSDFAAAQTHYQQAGRLAEQYGDQRGAALVLRNQGVLATKQAQLSQALTFFQDSLKALALDDIDEDHRRDQLICTLQSSLAEIYYRQGDFPTALAHYEQGLNLGKQINYQEGTAQALFGLGTINRFLGNYEAAQQALEESLILIRQAGIKDKEAAVLNNLGTTYTGRSNFRAALDCFRQSLELKESLRDPSRLATTLNNIGLLYQYQGDDDLALDYYQRSLQAAQAGKSPQRAAYTLNNLGYLHGLRGRHESALNYLQQSIALGDPETVAQARINIGQVYAAEKKYDEAASYFAESLKWSRATGNRRIETICLDLLSDVAHARGEMPQALAASEQAVRLARELDQPEALQQALTSLARIYRMLKQPEKAHRALAEAIDQIEGIRNQAAGGAYAQEQVFAERVSVWQEMIALLLDEQQTAEAFSYAERAKARALLDVLRSGQINITKAMTAVERTEERRLQNELATLNARLYRVRAIAQPERTQSALLTDLNEQLKRAQLNLADFQAQLYAAHPELQAQRGEAPVFTLTQAGQLLPDQETALLEYAVTAEKAFLFVIIADTAGTPRLHVYELAAGRKELQELASGFRQQLAGHELTFKPAAARLYQLLFKPAAPLLAGKTKLVIVPDAGLWELPFQALLDETDHYLLERFIVSYTPSLTALAAIRQTHNPPAPAKGGLRLLAFGNPSLGLPDRSRDTARSQLRNAETSLQPLRSSETEVRALAQLYGPQHSRVYVGTEAREERLKAEAADARILHIAAHGLLNDNNPMYSQIVFAQTAARNSDISQHPEDGLLETWEIMKLDLHVDLAVLSACETARGRIGEGEGMIGLSWAFFIAGTPVTVVSQWKVEAESTTTLMREFHRHLQARYRSSPAATLAPAAALREAALKMLRSQRYRHPLYWASFVVVGDGL